MAEDLHDGRGEAALRKNRRAFHEQHDRGVGDLVADAVLYGNVHSLGPRLKKRPQRGLRPVVAYSCLFVRHARLQSERVKLVAHSAAQGLVDHLMLLYPALAAESAGDNMRGVM